MYPTVRRQKVVEGIYPTVKGHIVSDGLLLVLGNQCVHGLIVHPHPAVLHFAPIVALVFVFYFLLIGNCQLVILLNILVAPFTHLRLGKSRLFSISLVNLCL